MCRAGSGPRRPTTPAPRPQRPGQEVLIAVPGAPTGPALASGPAHRPSRAPLRPGEGCSEAGGPSCQQGRVLHKSLSLLCPPPTMGCDLGGPSELRPTPVRCRNPPSCLQRGPNCTCDAAPFAISAQQTGWLPPFKGRLSPGITADAAGILGRQRPAPGPPKPAGAFKGSEAFISCRRRARPPLPASP